MIFSDVFGVYYAFGFRVSTLALAQGRQGSAWFKGLRVLVEDLPCIERSAKQLPIAMEPISLARRALEFKPQAFHLLSLNPYEPVSRKHKQNRNQRTMQQLYRFMNTPTGPRSIRQSRNATQP